MFNTEEPQLALSSDVPGSAVAQAVSDLETTHSQGRIQFCHPYALLSNVSIVMSRLAGGLPSSPTLPATARSTNLG